jgi:hypothetical protein
MTTKPNENTQQKMQENWLAPHGSELETQMIESLLSYKRLTQDERGMLLRYRKSRDSREMHNSGFWKTAKKLKLGSPENYELAMSRHKKLESKSGGKGNTWLVAYCIANSEAKTLKEIGEKLGIGVDGVKFHKSKISEIISEEYGHQIQGMADDALITRWFLGL